MKAEIIKMEVAAKRIRKRHGAGHPPARMVSIMMEVCGFTPTMVARISRLLSRETDVKGYGPRYPESCPGAKGGAQ